MFCTAAPEAPLSRLSTAETSTSFPARLSTAAEDFLHLRQLPDVDHDGLELPARYGDEVRYERHLRHLPHTPQNSLDLRCVPVPRRPVGACTLVHADEVSLYTRLRPCPACPGKGVDSNGAYPHPHTPHHRSKSQNGRRRIATRVGDEPSRRSPEDLGQPVVCLPEKLGRGMLPVPLRV